MDTEPGMAAALAAARTALDAGELPIGAALTIGGDVVARAHTRERAERRYLVHAELLALIELDRQQPSFQDRRRATLFTTVEPCVMCLGAAMSAFVGTIVYALPSPTDGATTWLTASRPDRPGFES